MLKSRIALAMTAVALALPAAARADTYVVQLKDAPLATYAGGTAGIAATSPRQTHRKLKADSAPGLDYRAYLGRRQSAVLGRLSGSRPRVLYAYRYALSGFAADLSHAQAAQLAKAPDVASVEPALDEHLMGDDQDDGLGGEPAAYLGLTREDGLWDELGGPLAAAGAGAGVIVGDIDTGIQPGHPSFADVPDAGYEGDAYTAPPVWDGACEAGDGFDVTDCNNKLIGARYFVSGFGDANVAHGSFLSPRDDDGHGTHTASTAAGNYGVHPEIDNSDLGVDIISGVAPRAYVAAYKACWNGNGTTGQTGCNSADVVAAIDQAVADGVDVINMSIGATTSALFGPQQAALLNAAAAGVFVANSAGNTGPGAGTIGAPADVPWTTAVAADSLARSFQATVTLSTGLAVTGASVTGAVGPAPVVDGAASGLGGVSATLAAQCEPNALDPNLVRGAIVLCVRGGNDRIDKSKQVLAAGGAGMILYNSTAAQELDTDSHWVPTVQLTNADGLRVKAAIAPGVQATLGAGRAASPTPAKVVAAFSSRGPQTTVPDIAKPDLTAPGVQILAGTADMPAAVGGNRPGQLFAVMQGTSMSAPMVAGAAALLTQVMPTLSPAEIKSELMLTANPAVVKEDGTTPATPFDQGSGEIDPERAAHAGLVLDATLDDYIHYLEFEDPSIVVGDFPKLRPTDLNLPSIAFSRLVGQDSTTRTFTSIDPTATRWSVAVKAPPGTTAVVDTPFFTIKPGQTQPVKVTITRTSAAFDAWTFGALTLTSDDGLRTLRLPISVKPAFGTVTTPVPVSASASSGSVPLTMRSGWAGSLSETAFGLAAPQAMATGKRITATTAKVDLSGNDPGTQLYPLTIASGAQFVSARLSNVDAGANLDLFLYQDPNSDGNLSDARLIQSSRRTDSSEQINIAFPGAGHYVVAVLGVSGSAAYDLRDWVVSDATPDSLTGGPALAVTDDPLTVAAGDQPALPLRWAGVDAPGLYLGVVIYAGPDSPALPRFSAISLVELTRAADPPPTPTPTPTPTVSPTPTATATPTATPLAVPDTAAPAAPRTAGVAVQSVRLSGRTLRLRVANANGARVHVSILRDGRVVAATSSRRVPGRGAVDLRLRLTLRPGRYTVKVTAERDGRRTVARVPLRLNSRSIR